MKRFFFKNVLRPLLFTPAMQRNLATPQAGWVGTLAKKVMQKANRPSSIHAVDSLGLTRHARVLEIGFGSGYGLEAALDAIGTTTHKPAVFGLEYSRRMLEETETRLRGAIQRGELQLHHGDVHALTMFEDEQFSHVLHVNCCYFWRDLPGALREIQRTMQSGGQMLSATKFHAIAGNDPEIFRHQNRDVYLDALREAGFQSIEVKRIDLGDPSRNYEAILCQAP